MPLAARERGGESERGGGVVDVVRGAGRAPHAPAPLCVREATMHTAPLPRLPAYSWMPAQVTVARDTKPVHERKKRSFTN